MGLDRSDPDYRFVEKMLVGYGYSDLRDVLDAVVDGARDDDPRGSIATTIDRLPRSSSEKARLRLALWFWDSALSSIRRADLAQLDPTNRERFVDTMAGLLGVPR